MTLTFGSLFAGIGGMDLGLERAGMVCRWQVEIDDYCRRVLAKHWPDVPKYGDIREVTGEELERVDLICGGFPCQDISNAGKRAGIDGERSGLWSEYIRLVRVLRPRYVLVENVAALLDGELTAYSATWPRAGMTRNGIAFRLPPLVPLTSVIGSLWPTMTATQILTSSEPRKVRLMRRRFTRNGGVEGLVDGGWWATEPPVGRVVDGFPGRVDRLRGLGNAVVPQCAEFIGRRILEAA
jgi:DNA (cytosine-5)-methyltransferase 1